MAISPCRPCIVCRTCTSFRNRQGSASHRCQFVRRYQLEIEQDIQLAAFLDVTDLENSIGDHAYRHQRKRQRASVHINDFIHPQQSVRLLSVPVRVNDIPGFNGHVPDNNRLRRFRASAIWITA